MNVLIYSSKTKDFRLLETFSIVLDKIRSTLTIAVCGLSRGDLILGVFLEQSLNLLVNNYRYH